MLLRSKDRALLLQVLDNCVKTEAVVWAFGSRVTGRAHSGSDLDLVIKPKNNQPLAASELTMFKAELQQSNLPFLVDVLDWERIPETFKTSISQQYEALKL